MTKRKIIADLHTHTISSGHAYNTIYEMAQYAENIGLKYLAITDHGPQIRGAATDLYFRVIKRNPPVLFNVNMLYGIELNIVSENGDIDETIDNRLLENLDINLLGIHPFCKYEFDNIEKNTNAIINALEKHSSIKFLSHLENLGMPVNLEKVIDYCAKNRIILELNNSSLRYSYGRTSDERLCEFLTLIRENSLPVVINSDAHCATDLAEVSEMFEILDRFNFNDIVVLNEDLQLFEDQIINKNYFK